MTDFNELPELATSLGAFKASAISVDQISFDATLRKACEVNYCGNYGKNWMCPPDIGGIDDLIESAKRYKYALVFQTVSNLLDSFDVEGMEEALRKHREVTAKIGEALRQRGCGDMLELSAGGCTLCQPCAKRTGEPCRHPGQAVPSLEAYGMYVAKMASLCGMNYINGKNTVTYFGAFLVK